MFTEQHYHLHAERHKDHIASAERRRWAQAVLQKPASKLRWHQRLLAEIRASLIGTVRAPKSTNDVWRPI